MKSEDSRFAFLQQQEALYDLRVPTGQWIVLRLDGRGFSSFTEAHFQKPFDAQFQEYMVATARALLIELDALYVYQGSDEISVVLKPEFDQWDRRVEKLLSLPAALATAEFIERSHLRVQFDCRLLPFQRKEEVIACCEWRRADVRRNALQTCCYWTLRNKGESPSGATKRLRKASWTEKEKLLEEHGIIFKALPSWQRQGVSVLWETYEKAGFNPMQQVEVLAQRRRPGTSDIPGEGYGTWLASHLPS